MGDGFRLDGGQRLALLRMLASYHLVHTLTAGTGCGKTAMMEMLAHVARDRNILFCAPTGKAAKVLSSRVRRYGRSAVTIHSLLGVKDEGYRHDPDNPLDADIVVVDESSMLDLALARALLDALADLPEDQRAAFLLQAEGDLSVADIAAATGVPQETAKTRLRYARAKLRQALEVLA